MAIIRAEIGKRDQETKNAIIAELTDVLVKYGSPRENTTSCCTRCRTTTGPRAA